MRALEQTPSSSPAQAARYHGAVAVACASKLAGGATGFQPAVTSLTRKRALQLYPCHVVCMTAWYLSHAWP